MKHPSISVIVPAFNEEAYLPACLSHILEEVQGSGIGAEVIVVNNASTDATEEIARSFPGVRVINENRKGLTQARQAGLAAASGEILAYVDADTQMPRGWLTHIAVAFSEKQDRVCMSGPYTFYDLSAFARHLAWGYWLFLVWPTYLFTGFMVVGGNFAARKASIEQIGGFDTSIAFYGEDANIGRRLNAVGSVDFFIRLYMPTSARRLKHEGLFRMALRYSRNFLSEAILKRPATVPYKDIR